MSSNRHSGVIARVEECLLKAVVVRMAGLFPFGAAVPSREGREERVRYLGRGSAPKVE